MIGATTPIDPKTERAFDLLKRAARDLELVDYGDLADAIGVAAVGIRRYLHEIYEFCRREGYPCLNVLAVSKATGRPSINPAPYSQDEVPVNLEGIVYWCTEMIRVFSFDWSGVHLK